MRIKEFFKRRNGKLIPDYTINDFCVGMIIKMTPGYYTRDCYYIEVIEVGKDYIVTSIPEQHTLKIEVDSPTWKYQIPRMTILGMGYDYGHLLHHQNLI